MDPRDPSFLGTGWTFPPTFSRSQASVVMAPGAADIQDSLHALFGTIPGEREMVPTFGCEIWTMVFGTLNTTMVTQIDHAIRTAVLNWEPRIDVDEVTVQEAPGVDGLVSVNVAYTIRRTNTRDNLVYPFYLREGTLVPSAG